MSLTIKPGAATQDIKDIEQIVSTIDQSMLTLNEAINKLIPEGVETDWSRNLKESWTKCYENSVKNAMDGMKASATNLQNAVDAALEYNKG